VLTKRDLLPLAKGIRIDGTRAAPPNFQILSAAIKAGSSAVELTIHAGRNHQVKKMFQAGGFPVQKLKREYYGELSLQGLRQGQYS
ncbi:pseudouridine synthase, partial [Enterococcus faecalis]|nr:pseudouridine synthase [Enterococcus faecalis]